MTWIAPRMIAWYFRPPVQPGACDCTAPIEWALSKYQLAQVFGLLGGAGLGLILFFLLLQRAKSKAVPPPPVRRQI
jgi:hypothetical protein